LSSSAAGGNTWSITQDGHRLNIQETHRESREVWKKGAGEVRGRTIAFRLDLVFERGHRYVGELQLSGVAGPCRVRSRASLTGAPNP
jgi:hypothetical protein